MKNPEISILIPIYNAEKYLVRCLDSIKKQDFCDYEVIMVNDGSADKSLEICKSYTQKDKRFITVDKKNEGIAKTRLKSYEVAKGKYLVFLDADDYLLPNALQILFSEIEKGYEIVRTPVLRENNEGKRWIDHYEIENLILEDTKEYTRFIILDKIAPYLHCAIYKADIFNRDVFLTSAEKNIDIGEDWIANYLISPKVKSIKFINTPTHVYCVNNNSTMKTYIRGWKYQYKIREALYNFNSNLPPELKELVQYNSTLNKLRFFFQPEISFNWNEYRLIEANIDMAISKLGSEKQINKKHLYFIHYPLLYFLYTRLYSFYFFVRYRKFKLFTLID